MFRFTIRDVLWLTVVVALALGWGVNHYSQRAALQRLQKDRLFLQAHKAAGEAYEREATRAMELLLEERARADKLQEELSRLNDQSAD